MGRYQGIFGITMTRWSPGFEPRRAHRCCEKHNEVDLSSLVRCRVESGNEGLPGRISVPGELPEQCAGNPRLDPGARGSDLSCRPILGSSLLVPVGCSDEVLVGQAVDRDVVLLAHLSQHVAVPIGPRFLSSVARRDVRRVGDGIDNCDRSAAASSPVSC